MFCCSCVISGGCCEGDCANDVGGADCAADDINVGGVPGAYVPPVVAVAPAAPAICDPVGGANVLAVGGPPNDVGGADVAGAANEVAIGGAP
jgi:hypothetical protein